MAYFPQPARRNGSWDPNPPTVWQGPLPQQWPGQQQYPQQQGGGTQMMPNQWMNYQQGQQPPSPWGQAAQQQLPYYGQPQQNPAYLQQWQQMAAQMGMQSGGPLRQKPDMMGQQVWGQPQQQPQNPWGQAAQGQLPYYGQSQQNPADKQQWQQMMGQQGGDQPLRQKPDMMGQQVYGQPQQQNGGFAQPQMSAQGGGASFPGGLMGQQSGTSTQPGSGTQMMPEWLRQMGQGPVYNSAPAGGGLTGQQSGGASWPGGLGGIQSNYPWWGGPQQTNSVNGAVYSEMPAFEQPNWFNNAPWDVTQWQNMTPEQLQATIAFNQQAMPWIQMAMNYNQFQNEFNQNAYQWGNEFGWKMLSDQFAMDMATRQQDTSERQWGSEFGLQTRKQDFSERQWGDEFGLKTREQDDLNKWRDTQATLEREKMVTDQENAALAAWGRKLRPNTRWM